MEVTVSRAGVPRVTDVTDDLTLSGKLSRCQAIRITLKMSVIKDQFLVRAELIDCRSTAVALKQSQNFSVARRHHRSSRWSHDIDGVVCTSFRARVSKGVLQLFRSHPC